MRKPQIPKIPKKWTLVIAAFIVALAALAPSYYFYNEYQKSQSLLKNPTQAAAQEVKVIKDKVARHMELPSGEEPTLATVSDKEKLRDQAFFAKAENGDKVLIYTQARKAILYRPSIDKIIEVSTVNLGSPTQDEVSKEPQVVKVVLRNGTTTTGLTNKVEPEVKKAIANVEIVDKENASKNDYEKTLVVVLNPEAKEAAATLAEALEATVVEQLPEGEEKPSEADIVVILGKDRT